MGIQACVRVVHTGAWALALLSLWPLSARAEADLSGTYRVKGECAIRKSNGTYQNCVAWNTLDLQRHGPNEYQFELVTNTFATTPGGCGVDGRLQVQRSGNTLLLKTGNEGADVCRVAFEVDKRRITLVPPQSGDADFYANDSACRAVCGMNSSLYSDPFPLKSRKPLQWQQK